MSRMDPDLREPAGGVETPDEELLPRVRRRDGLALEVLMRRHNQRLFRAARAIVSDDAEAEDVAQEAYVRAFQCLDQFRGESSFATWLTRIAVHEALARSKRRKRNVALVHDGEAPPGSSLFPVDRPTPERNAEVGELRGVLLEAVQSLADTPRLVFVLREVEGLSTAETSEITGLSETNVKVTLHRARATLRRRIDHTIGAEVRALWTFAGDRCDRVVASVLRQLCS